MQLNTKLPSNICHNQILATEDPCKLPKMPSIQLRIKQRIAVRNQGNNGHELGSFNI